MKNILANPVKYKADIEKLIKRQIHVYLPGDYYPSILGDLFLTIERKGQKGETTNIDILKSGVYKFGNMPGIDAAQKHYTALGDACATYATRTTEQEYNSNYHLRHELYKQNVYKPAFIPKASYQERKQTNFKLKDILKSTGNGVYYFLGCRAFSHNNIFLF
jgi:hypothetical protein